jgi:hypothetical protein
MAGFYPVKHWMAGYNLMFTKARLLFVVRFGTAGNSSVAEGESSTFIALIIDNKGEIYLTL